MPSPYTFCQTSFHTLHATCGTLDQFMWGPMRGLEFALDNQIIAAARGAIERGEPVVFQSKVENVNRTVGTMLSHEVTKAGGY